MLIFWEDVLFCYVLDYASEKFLWLTNKEKKRPVFSSSTSKDLNYITEDYSYKSKEDYL